MSHGCKHGKVYHCKPDEHEFELCEGCDVIFCKKCGKEWIFSKNPDFEQQTKTSKNMEELKRMMEEWERQHPIVRDVYGPKWPIDPVVPHYPYSGREIREYPVVTWGTGAPMPEGGHNTCWNHGI